MIIKPLLLLVRRRQGSPTTPTTAAASAATAGSTLPALLYILLVAALLVTSLALLHRAASDPRGLFGEPAGSLGGDGGSGSRNTRRPNAKPPSRPQPRVAGGVTTNSNSSSSGLRIALVTVAIGDTWYYPASLANKRAYALRHGYDLIVLSDADADTPDALAPPAPGTGSDRPPPAPEKPHPVWAKVTGLRRHAAEYDWLWLLDADAFVANEAVRVEAFVEEVERLHRARRRVAVTWEEVEEEEREVERMRKGRGGREEEEEDEEEGEGEVEWEQTKEGWWTSRKSKKPPSRENVPGPPPTVLLPYPTVTSGDRAGPDIIVAMDCNGINAGSLFVRGARGSRRRRPQGDPVQNATSDDRPWILRFADVWLAQEPHRDAHTGLREQRALSLMIERNVLDARRRVATTPLRLINSYAPRYNRTCSARWDPYSRNYRAGDWVVHFVHDSKASMNESLAAMGML